MKKIAALGLMAFSVSCIAASAVEAAVANITLNQVPRSALNGGMGTIDLTAGGNAIDWFKGNGTGGAVALIGAEKDSATALTVTSPGTTAYAGYNDGGYRFTWSGGDATKPGGATGTVADNKTYQGVRWSPTTNDNGYRISFTAPSAGDYAVSLYAAALDPTPFDLTVTDTASNTVLDNEIIPTKLSGTTAPNNIDELAWTVTITGATAGQTFALDLFRNGTGSGQILALNAGSVVSVPEPASLGVFAGVTGLTLMRRRRA